MKLKPFNIEDAQSGKPIVTRLGHKARVICYDRDSLNNNYPIVAMFRTVDNTEDVNTYTVNGEYSKDRESDLDLFIAPVKHEGWANIYIDKKTRVKHTGSIYPTKEEALDAMRSGAIATTKIEWEE